VKASRTSTVGTSEADAASVESQRSWNRDSAKHVPAPRPAFRKAEDTIVRHAAIRAFGEIEVSDAEVPLLVLVLLERRSKRLRFRQRVIDPRVDVDAIGWTADRDTARPVRQGREDVGRIVERRPSRRQGERRAIFHERPIQVERVLLRLLRSFLAGERIARVERAVTKREIQAAPQRAEARLRRDIDEHHPAAMVFRGEQVAREPDRANLRLGRQSPAAEAVDTNRCARPCHLLQHLFHFIRVVGQCVDLLLRQDGVEPVAIGV
jgi:hypothetical protein